MKKLNLLLCAVILSVFSATCEEFKELYLHDPAGQWIEYTVEEGKHYSKPWIVAQVNSSYEGTGIDALVLEFEFCFPDSSCIYDIGEDQSDWNKLFGVTPFLAGTIHSYSFRFGWRWFDGLQIGYYNYINAPKPEKGVLTHIEIGVVYHAQIVVRKDEISLFLADTETWDYWQYCDDTREFEVYPVWYATVFHFGGNEPAPHDVNCNLKCDQLLPAVNLGKK